MEKKYKLIDYKTKEETVCDKVTIDGFDYYISDEKVRGGTFESLPFKNTKRGQSRIDSYILDKKVDKIFPIDFEHEYCVLDRHFLVLATNNFNIDIPKVIDEVEYLFKLAKDHSDKCGLDNFLDEDDIQIIKEHYTHGYKKSKETYQFTEQDMIEYSKYCIRQFALFQNRDDNFTKRILPEWKETQIKTVYYE